MTDRPTYTCRRVNDVKFKEAFAEAYEIAESEDAEKVMLSIFTNLNMRPGDRPDIAYLVAYDQAALENVVGVMVMLKANLSWCIEDLCSGRPGVGSALANFGIGLAISDYGNQSNCEISLISLNANSAKFWTKMGFCFRSERDKDSGHGAMVYRVPNSRPSLPITMAQASGSGTTQS